MTPSAPVRCAGLLAPLFALRRDGDLGIGDTKALRGLLHWAAQHEVGFVQLLPINEMGPDNSPYNAISSVALDPIFLEISAEKIPELTEGEVATVRESLSVESLDGPLVDYPTVRRAKRGLLEKAYERFRDPVRVAAFERFWEEEAGWLEDYAVFRTLIDVHGHECWDRWPEGARGSVEARDPRVQFHAWVQWLAFSQWRALREEGLKLGVRLMGDIPIGVSFYSADVFAKPELFDLEWCGGAPPEQVFKDDPFVVKWGQNWGIPLYRWDVMERGDFAWWRQRIDKLTDVFDIFRIDHVLGFYRIYGFPWRPQYNAEFLPLSEQEAAERTGGRLPHYIEHADDTPEHCAANLAAGDKYLRAVQAAAGGAEVVAEDLGSVPDYVRPHLLERGIPGFKVPQWEVDGSDHAIPGAEYAECSFATYATHDHPPLRAIWETNRHNMTDHPEHDERMKAGRELRLIAEFCGMPPQDHYPPYSPEVQGWLLRGLLTSSSRYAALMITDLFGMEDRFNRPGVVDGANWRTRLPFTVEDLSTLPELMGPVCELQTLIRQTNRSAVQRG
ncbi:MAG: 4-alpha-glucanotransferase [Verrucomicrobiales bacterium]|nr:4-alpha-glucanotransferase [Verrucomicrobiales bacterium]